MSSKKCYSKYKTFAEFKQNGRSCLIFFEKKIKCGGLIYGYMKMK